MLRIAQCLKYCGKIAKLKTRPSASENRCKLYPPKRQCTKTSRTNNKRVISTFRFGCPHLTLTVGSKFKSDHTRRFSAHDFLYVDLPSQTSRTNNKRVISTFKFGCPRLTLNERPKVKSDLISYRLVYHPKPLGPIISGL